MGSSAGPGGAGLRLGVTLGRTGRISLLDFVFIQLPQSNMARTPPSDCAISGRACVWYATVLRPFPGVLLALLTLRAASPRLCEPLPPK